ncbi:MAG: hypothetical protein RL630_637 [Verrucomicrobiota bacterium]|jgi:hypothetical protein
MATEEKIPAPRREVTCVLVEDQGLFLELLGGMLNMHGGLSPNPAFEVNFPG